ncbi:hypothetical protein [Nocardia thailandica]
MTETGTVQVDHHQFLLTSGDTDTTDVTAEGTLIWTGPGFVSVLTGIARGPVTLTLDPSPAADTDLDEWDIAEETVIETAAPLHVTALDGDLAPAFAPIPAGRYRIRVHARGRDTHYDRDVTHPCEEYLIQLTPTTDTLGELTQLHDTDTAHHTPDTVAGKPVPRLDSRVYVGGPDSGWVKVDPDSPEAHAAYAARGTWGGRAPSEYLNADPRRRHTASFVADLDRDLVDEVAALDPAQQRALARWCTRRAFERAGLTELADFRKALEAMDNATTPPPRFTTPSQLSQLVKNDPAIPLTVVARFGGYGDTIPQLDAATAYMYTVSSDDDLEPATKAFEAIRWTSFAFGQDYPELITRLRTEFFHRP